jgi:hypothetical protein
MSKSNATETDILAKIFTATALPWDGVTELDIHLHTADPGEGGTSATSEADYGGPYAAVAVSRTGSGWTVAGNTCTNDALIQFPICTSGSNAITYVSITPHGSTQILYSGALTGGGVTVSTGIQPQFAISALSIVED